MLTHIDGLFLHDLLAASVGVVRTETAIIAAITRVAALLIKRLVDVGGPVFLFYDEVRWDA